jgi:hypothetical protein
MLMQTWKLEAGSCRTKLRLPGWRGFVSVWIVCVAVPQVEMAGGGDELETLLPGLGGAAGCLLLLLRAWSRSVSAKKQKQNGSTAWLVPMSVAHSVVVGRL